MNRHGFEPCLIQRYVENRQLLLDRKAAREVGPELLDQQRNSVFATTLVTDRVFDHDFVELRIDVRRRLSPIGYSTTTSSNFDPSLNSTVSALAIERFSGSW